MASSPTFSKSALPLHFRRPPATLHRPISVPSPFLKCGPRDNRGPLVRGRTLSSEAILAVQALKRVAARGGVGGAAEIDGVVSSTFSRLIKSDLLAAIAELRRQGHARLALRAFVAARREFLHAADLALYADMITALSVSGGLEGELDLLISDLMAEGIVERLAYDAKGMVKLIRALLAAEKSQAVVDLYGRMKRAGWDPDEYAYRVLIKGLRRLGEEILADEVDKDFKVWFDGGDQTPPLVR